MEYNTDLMDLIKIGLKEYLKHDLDLDQNVLLNYFL